MDFSAPEYQANLQIPIDLFVSKKKRGGGGGSGGLRFTDASGNLVYRVERQSHNSTRKRVLFDASENALIHIARNHKGSWQCFKGNGSEESDLICRVDRTLKAFTKTEFEILPAGEIGEESKSDFKMKGSPFYRSCTVYRGNSILAQTSLMYKLGIQKVFVWRHRFRLTIFPGFEDHALIAALIVIFFEGRKLWI